MKRIIIVLFITLLTISCATTKPQEPPISVQLRGTSIEVQQFIEDIIFRTGIDFEIESATDRNLTLKTHCMNVPNMNAFKCSLIMMGIGNSNWDGPYSMITFRTNEIHGIVNLRVSSKWCAINPYGKINCMSDGNNAEGNDLLRKIDKSYQQKVRPLQKEAK